MFEWFWEFWEWLGQEVSSGRFWEPYLKLENWFYVIVIGWSILYFLVVFQPWNWFKKDENLEEEKEPTYPIPVDIYMEILTDSVDRMYVESCIKELSVCKKWFEKNIPLR